MQKIKTLLFSCLFVVFCCEKSYSCDPDCNHYHHIIFGGFSTLSTIALAPAIGALADGNPNSPYGRALGLTSLSATAAWGLGYILSSSPSNNYDNPKQAILTALPMVAGITTSIIVYTKAKNNSSRYSNSSIQRFKIGAIPIEQGALVYMTLDF